MELTRANFVVEVTLQNLVIEMYLGLVLEVANICPTPVCGHAIQKLLHRSGILNQIAIKNTFFDTLSHISKVGFCSEILWLEGKRLGEYCLDR